MVEWRWNDAGTMERGGVEESFLCLCGMKGWEEHGKDQPAIYEYEVG